MARRTSPEADDDFAAIYVYGVDNFGRSQADKYAISLLDAFDMLGASPGVGRERSEVDPPVRLWPHGSHNILYALVDGEVLILRVVHHSVLWARLFAGK